MASPFKVFRKHQKLMLAGLTILAMFSFVFLGVISDLIGNRGTQNPVVVRTSKYGNLLSRDIYYLHKERLRAFAVLEKMLLYAFNLNPPECRRAVENLFGTNSETDLVMTWLKAQRAQELGMQISDQAVVDFLQNFSQNRLAPQDISAIINQEGLSEKLFFQTMREQLQAFEISRLFMLSLRGISPGQRWHYFCQLRQQAAVELIPVDAERFLAQVDDPGNETLQAFYQQYKDKLPRPDSPEPGFRTPQKIALEYLKADIEKFSDPNTITEEEIQNCYEKYREQFDQLEKQGAAASLKAEEKAAVEPEDKAAMEKEKQETAPAGEESKEQPKEEKEQPKEQSPDAQRPAEQPAAPQQSSPQGDPEKSSATDHSPFRLTALAEEAEKPAADQPAAEQPEAAAPAPKESEQPEKAQAKSEETPQTGTGEPAAEKTDVAKPTLSEKVRERVRARVAREKIAKIFSQLRQKMDDNGKKWRTYEAQKIHNQAATPPAKLDLEALGKQYGLEAHQTGLVSHWDLLKLDIGSSYIRGSAPFTTGAFKTLATYKTDISLDAQGNEYLFWKINETPEATPSFDDQGVRQEVLRVWKLSRARDLALKGAEQLAETARKSATSLKEIFADRSEIQVLTPPPFSFYTEGGIPLGSSLTAPHLSEIEGVPMASADFMRAVFDLEEKQIGVAANAPKTVFYVIRLASYSPPQEVLWKIFLVEDFSKYISLATSDMEQAQRVWLEDLKTYAGLKWEQRPADQGAPQPAEDYYEE